MLILRFGYGLRVEVFQVMGGGGGTPPQKALTDFSIMQAQITSLDRKSQFLDSPETKAIH